MDLQDEKELKVIICRQPGNNRQGEISVSQISNVHWSNISGGVNCRQGAYYLYGYIPYNMAMDLVACSGTHERYHGDAKVCICKSHNRGEYIEGYDYLVQLAGEKPPSIISQHRPEKQPPCTKKIMELINDEPISRGELRTILLQIGYQPNTIVSALKSLKQQQRIILIGHSSSPKQIVAKKETEETV